MLQHKDMNDVVAEFSTKCHADIIEFYYNWKFHEPDYSRWQCTKRQMDIILVSRHTRAEETIPRYALRQQQRLSQMAIYKIDTFFPVFRLKTRNQERTRGRIRLFALNQRV